MRRAAFLSATTLIGLTLIAVRSAFTADAPAAGPASASKDPTAAQTAPPLDAASSAIAARNVLRQYCHRCHEGQGSAGGDFDLLKHADLLSAPSDENLIVPKHPEQSLVVRRIVKGEMPPGDQPRPDLKDLASLWQWIDAGSPEFPKSESRQFIPLQTVLDQMVAYLRDPKLDRRDRPFQRFFTLHQLYNNPAVSDDDLRMYRAALSKAINSLSQKPAIVLPQAIDPQQTLFVVDIRRLDWDRKNLWEEILRAYPYGLTYASNPDRALQTAGDELAELTDCEMPFIRADWFVATATRPPLYDTLLQLPANARMLESELGVDVAANFDSPMPDRIARAGFAHSGVSGQNRLVERHSSKNGSYWKSYDFKPDNPRSKLTLYPLGPLNLFAKGRHPYPDQAFVHDGGEIIFSLPNKLHGYMLIKGDEERIEVGPIAVVSDALKTSGTPEIVAGVSCMACHTHGLLPVKDTIRESSAVFGAAERKVRDLFPPRKTMDQLLKQDREEYTAALEKAVGPFLRQGADKDKPLEQFPDPVGIAARHYRLEFLDLQTVAKELDLESSDVILQNVGATKLKRLGLETLLKPGGVISRAEWEATAGVSLMQQLARELRCTPWHKL
jgi:hypothetical protein